MTKDLSFLLLQADGRKSNAHCEISLLNEVKRVTFLSESTQDRTLGDFQRLKKVCQAPQDVDRLILKERDC
jgi:hypothetical protein